jgi:hypothetical protein
MKRLSFKTVRRMARTLKQRKPDASIHESKYKVDLEILDRYIGFSSEILRISLLAIGGFGALVLAKFDNSSPDISFSCYLIASMGFFILSSGFALVHRFVATDSMAWYISFLRKIKATRYANAVYQKAGFHKRLNWSRIALIACEVSFIIAVGLFALGIYCMIYPAEKCCIK